MLDKRGGASHQGCEGCHGPGAGHVANPVDMTKIFSFKTQSAKAINNRCLTCHASGKEQMDFARSEHNKNNISCVDCHSPHHSKDPEFLLVKSQPELCYTCHLQKKPDFAMPFHHRVNEGLIQCSDCHNPHGTVGAKQVRTSATQDAVCYTCHADKRGPFVFEHGSVKVEGCNTCHMPHGSTNARLLKRPMVFTLCLECHNGQGTFGSFGVFKHGVQNPLSEHNLADPRFQNCTTCHVKIHGSNTSEFFFR
jgi:DmsE family decaheme c-type cytochrome